MTRLVRSASLTHFAEIAVRYGLDARAAVEQAGLPVRCLTDPDLKIDAEAAMGLLEDAAARAGEPALGLLMGDRRRLSNLGPLAVALRDEPTLRHSLDVVARYIRLHNEALVLRPERQGHVVILHIDLLSDHGRYYRQGIELATMVVLRSTHLYMGVHWRPRAVCFAHQAPPSLATHLQLLDARVEFGHDFNGIVCDSADLDTPNPRADPLIAQYGEQWLKTLPGGSPLFHEQVKELISILLPLGRCNADAVAQHLGCDRRTVNRRLGAQGLSFMQLVDEHRRALARTYIDEQPHTLDHIARLLGFSSRSTLSRWYRQQFGHSPRASRQAD